METTTIQISKDLLKKLQDMKLYIKESYEEVIWDLVEDHMELSEETKKNIKEAEADVSAGRVVSFDSVKERYKKNV